MLAVLSPRARRRIKTYFNCTSSQANRTMLLCCAPACIMHLLTAKVGLFRYMWIGLRCMAYVCHQKRLTIRYRELWYSRYVNNNARVHVYPTSWVFNKIHVHDQHVTGVQLRVCRKRKRRDRNTTEFPTGWKMSAAVSIDLEKSRDCLLHEITNVWSFALLSIVVR